MRERRHDGDRPRPRLYTKAEFRGRSDVLVDDVAECPDAGPSVPVGRALGSSRRRPIWVGNRCGCSASADERCVALRVDDQVSLPVAADEDLDAELATDRRSAMLAMVCPLCAQLMLEASGDGRSPEESAPVTTRKPAPSVWVIVTLTNTASRKRSSSGTERSRSPSRPLSASPRRAERHRFVSRRDEPG